MAGQENLPDWIQQRNFQHDEAERRKAEKLQRNQDDAHFVSKHGPEFWAQLTDAIHRNTRALEHLKGESLKGSSSLETGGENSKRQTCHVQVIPTRPNEPFVMDLIYTMGAFEIIRFYAHNESRPIRLLRETEVILGDEASGPLTAEKLAERLVQDMVKVAKSNVSI